MNIDVLMKYKPVHISEKIRFWMIRTKKGYFYEEFVKNSFVALGWNEISADNYFTKENMIINSKKE